MDTVKTILEIVWMVMVCIAIVNLNKRLTKLEDKHPEEQ